jgi:hypothetical protein
MQQSRVSGLLPTVILQQSRGGDCCTAQLIYENS